MLPRNSIKFCPEYHPCVSDYQPSLMYYTSSVAVTCLRGDGSVGTPLTTKYAGIIKCIMSRLMDLSLKNTNEYHAYYWLSLFLCIF